MLFALMVLPLPGCEETIRYKCPQFREIGTGNFELISEDLGYNRVTDMFIYGQYAVLLTPDRTDGTCIQIYDKDTGKRLCGAVHQGRGPGEVLVGLHLSSFDMALGNVLMYEQGRHAMVVCNMEKMIAGEEDAIYEEGRLFPNAMSKYYQLGEDKSLLVCNVSPVTKDTTRIPRFKICDKFDNELFRSYGYPYEENSFFRWNLYTFAVSGLTPGKDRLAIGTSYGAVLETYDIQGDSLKKRSVSYFIEPGIGNGRRFTNDDTILGFNDIYAAEKAIYAAYDGENTGAVSSSLFFHNIAVFDWDGTPLNLIDMGMRIEQLCMDCETDVLYAIVEDSDGRCYLAKTLL